MQNASDPRRIDIDKVGVKGIRYPIIVLDRQKGTQNTVANINMFVNLPHQFKGTHMSRFIEILNEYRREINIRNFPNILIEMKRRLDAASAHLEVEFPYFIKKKAPISGAEGLMEYVCKIHGVASPTTKIDLGVEVRVPITTLCPCSKEISDGGAHNQRGTVALAVRFNHMIWIEDLIDIVETCASCEIYSLLKREDEKYVTERAYDNPMFVEDVVREVARKMMDDENINWFAVWADNIESIHNHNAYAYIERSKRPV